jgi:His-Xaa-Ser system radical SAM maturase HxsC
MIPLTLPAEAEAQQRYVARLKTGAITHELDAKFIVEANGTLIFAGANGLVAIDGAAAIDLDGDIVLVDPVGRRTERLLRAGSRHNTLLATERCDQLCLMCSQPPKKTHIDRFAEYGQACILAEPNSVIGISGGEPTLFKAELLAMVEAVLSERPDIRFHILTNGQHFDIDDVERLRNPLYRRVQWGIPLYASQAVLHDEIVAKAGAYDRLHQSFIHLLRAGASIELRTVVLKSNLADLANLASHLSTNLRFIHGWSIMQLEHIGFARRRWAELYVDHRYEFAPIAEAINRATLFGIDVALFNFPRCTVPPAYRALAPASISDWKRKFMAGCNDCREQAACSGFFEWHPDDGKVTPL